MSWAPGRSLKSAWLGLNGLGANVATLVGTWAALYVVEDSRGPAPDVGDVLVYGVALSLGFTFEVRP